MRTTTTTTIPHNLFSIFFFPLSPSAHVNGKRKRYRIIMYPPRTLLSPHEYIPYTNSRATTIPTRHRRVKGVEIWLGTSEKKKKKVRENMSCTARAVLVAAVVSWD